jgi:hypothetical protein
MYHHRLLFLSIQAFNAGHSRLILPIRTHIEAANDSGGAPVAVPDDGSVIEALRRGDETAFARLVDHYHASLGRVARLSGKADAVTQCAFGFTDDGVSRFANSAMRWSRI